MRNSTSFWTVLSLIAAFAFAGCGSHDFSDQRRYGLTGTWTNGETGANLLITDDGRFRLTTDADREQLSGRVERGGSELTFIVLRGADACEDKNATYRFEATLSSLLLEVSNDDCPERRALLQGPWLMSGVNRTQIGG